MRYEKQAVKNKNWTKKNHHEKSVHSNRLDIIIIFNTFIQHYRRYRLFPRFKARLTNTPYEDIVISEGKPSKPSPA